MVAHRSCNLEGANFVANAVKIGNPFGPINKSDWTEKNLSIYVTRFFDPIFVAHRLNIIRTGSVYEPRKIIFF